MPFCKRCGQPMRVCENNLVYHYKMPNGVETWDYELRYECPECDDFEVWPATSPPPAAVMADDSPVKNVTEYMESIEQAKDQRFVNLYIRK